MRFLFVLMLACATFMPAQIINKTDSNRVRQSTQDTLVVDNGRKDSMKIFKPAIEDYRWSTQYGQSQPFDTSFSVRHYYRFSRYNNEDAFGKVPFGNIGAGFQELVFRLHPEQDLAVLPTNKSYTLLGIDAVRYYDVKTPTTRFVYHSAMKQGAALQSTYTQNLGKSFNFSVEYMGLRSMGFYTNQLAANNRTLFTGHYSSPGGKYEAFAHYIHQNVNNEENGGIADIGLFTGGDSRFRNRQNLAVNLNGSRSQFWYRRYYFSHSFRPFASERFPFKIRHTIFSQTNKYYFQLGTADHAAFEAVQDGLDPVGKKFSENLSNTVSILFDNDKFKLDAGARYQRLKLGYKDVFLTNSPENTVSESRIGAVGNLQIRLWDRLGVQSALEYSTGSEFGSYLSSASSLRFEPVKGYFADAVVNFKNAAPGFNWMVNSSAVLPANFDVRDFKNETALQIGGKIGLKWFDASVFANFFRIENYAYFDAAAQPKQSSEALGISQVGGDATFSLRKFHLNATLLFQSALSGKALYPMPNFVGRANFYWQSWAFKDAAEIMAGIKVNYFSKFASREFSPILNEFVLAGARGYSIGGQPIADAYVNMRVKTMQFYIEGSNFTTLFMKNQSYTAPYYPIYDFRLNIGIVWQLFH